MNMKEDYIALVGPIIKEENGVVTRKVEHYKVMEEELHFDIVVPGKRGDVKQRVNIAPAELAAIKRFLKNHSWKDLGRMYRKEVVEKLKVEIPKSQKRKNRRVSNE